MSQGKALNERKSYHFYLVRYIVHKGNIIVINLYVPNNVNLKYVKHQIIKRNRKHWQN